MRQTAAPILITPESLTLQHFTNATIKHGTMQSPFKSLWSHQGHQSLGLPYARCGPRPRNHLQRGGWDWLMEIRINLSKSVFVWRWKKTQVRLLCISMLNHNYLTTINNGKSVWPSNRSYIERSKALNVGIAWRTLFKVIDLCWRDLFVASSVKTQVYHHGWTRHPPTLFVVSPHIHMWFLRCISEDIVWFLNVYSHSQQTV